MARKTGDPSGLTTEDKEENIREFVEVLSGERERQDKSPVNAFGFLGVALLVGGMVISFTTDAKWTIWIVGLGIVSIVIAFIVLWTEHEKRGGGDGPLDPTDNLPGAP